MYMFVIENEKVPPPLSQIEDWLNENIPQGYRILNGTTQQFVCVTAEKPAIHFKLRWGDYIVREWVEYNAPDLRT